MSGLVTSQLADLARAALQDQTEEAAEIVLRDWLSAQGPDPAVLHWRALLLRALDRRAEAMVQLQQAIGLSPGDPVLALALAQVAFEAGLASAPLYEAALRLAPTSGEARLGLIAAYFADGQGDQALGLLRGALASNPGWRDGYRQYAQLATLLGRANEAVAPLLQTIARFPDALPLQIDALEMLMAAGDYAATVELCDQGLARLGQLPELLIRKATALDELGQTSQAGALFAACGTPVDPIHACRLIRHLLRQGSAHAALEQAQPWLEGQHATDVGPYVSLAWRMLGDPQCDWLEGRQRLVGSYDLGPDAVDWPRLADRLRRIHAVSGQFSNQSVNGGTQTDGPLFARIEPEIAQVRQVVVDAMHAHLASLPSQDPGHPQLCLRRDKPVRFSGSWSVRLNDQGFHKYHHHPQGWFSAVLYVTVPDGLRQTDGQLALGGSPPELNLPITPFRHVEPLTGRLVVFPSTMWHATEAFDAGERMTIAFDLARPAPEKRE